MNNLPLQLDYAPAPRGRHAWWYGLLLILVAASAAGNWRESIRSWILVRYWQYRVAHFTRPADFVVLTSDRKQPHSRIIAHELMLMRCDYSAIFLHARTSPLGNQRVICFEFSHGKCGLDSSLTMHCQVCTRNRRWFARVTKTSSLRCYPADFDLEAESRKAVLRIPWTRPFPEDPHLTIFAGQPDINDSAHFTVAYRYGDHRGIIDGYLRDDDYVDLKPRDGKLTVYRPNAVDSRLQFYWELPVAKPLP